MVVFKQRSYKKELLDAPGIPFEAIRQNMQELNTINHKLGGHAITLKGIAKLLQPSNKLFKNPIAIVEIGCGGGDNLSVIKKWATEHNLAVQLTGIDINPECIAFAKTVVANEGINFICADYKEAILQQKPDVIFSSLFCHHFTDDDLVTMLQWMQQNASVGFFINDLHRHPLAYLSIKLLTKTFSKSYLVKNDAPLSVLRGFAKKDWIQLFKKANINHYDCAWQWAFRWLVTYKD